MLIEAMIHHAQRVVCAIVMHSHARQRQIHVGVQLNHKVTEVVALFAQPDALVRVM